MYLSIQADVLNNLEMAKNIGIYERSYEKYYKLKITPATLILY
jgi:hypothetical protein